MSISTVVIQEQIYKHNIHQEITPPIPSALLIPQFNTHESTADSERQTSKNKNVIRIPNQKAYSTLPIPNNYI